MYRDPLAELQLLTAQQTRASGQGVGALRNSRVQLLASTTITPELRDRLVEAELTATFDAASQTARESSIYRDTLATITATKLAIYPNTIVRAVVAEAAMQSEAQGQTPAILSDATVRDAVVSALADQLALPDAGVLAIFTPLEHKSVQIVTQLLTSQLRERRGKVMDKVLKFIGDILVYHGAAHALSSLAQHL